MTAEEQRTVSVGERFSFALPANPTTGFDWQVDFPPELIRLESREHTRSSDLIGAGGTTTITLSALRAGEAVVRLRYLRAWEGRPVEERSVRVRVEPKH
jgi:predicted secreted protein